jgi:CRISPR-associated protein Csd1
MIIQALTELYEVLAKQGKVNKPGWSKVKVSYGLELDEQGNLIRVVNLKSPSADGKKMLPVEMSLPMPAKRASKPISNFLCDTSSYILGVDDKGKADRTAICFELCKSLHKTLLYKSESPYAKSIVNFFENWNSAEALNILENIGCSEKIIEDIVKKGANLVLMPMGKFASDFEEISTAWQEHYDQNDGEKGICLVTGKNLPIAILHPSIKNIRGAQSVGASLVSFNAPAFVSYEKSQGMNSPVSEYAAFAYTTALNYLVSQFQYVNVLGDTTVVCWSQDNEEACQDIFCSIFGNDDNIIRQDELWGVINKLSKGMPVNWNSVTVNPDNRFYILGISPNSARLSIRFFLQNTFGNFMKNINAHQERMNIIAPSFEKYKYVSLWQMLSETVNPNSKNKSAKPQLAGSVLYSILQNQNYPETLFNGVEIRINADRRINRNRMAVIKAILLKNYENIIPREALEMKLNEECTYQPYVLGRLFSLLEEIQSSANPSINTTIKDRYFTSAGASPATVFPLLIDLAQKHLRKLDTSAKIYYQKQFTALVSMLKEELPAHLSMQEKGVFQIGYYHQTQKRFTKKEDK